MEKELYQAINYALDTRKSWALRQQTCYAMRNGGIRRTNKPYAGAPDGWYPLGDTMIEKVKPGYISQLYGSETITSFVSLKQQDEDMTQAASYWFDYLLKQKSNFERTMFVAIDQMLEQAFTPVKVYWDANCKQFAFDQVDPLHLIVPQSCQEYNKSGGTDWMVHVLHLTVDEYEANGQFKQGKEFVDRIKGKGNQAGITDSDGEAKQQDVDYREGINCSSNKDEIVLWEVYRKDRKSSKITIETISPLLPCEQDENVVRPSFGLPFNKGIFASGTHFPFFKIRAEIKGKGHYSSRGLIEINAPYESSLTKSWNTLHEWMDFSCRPMFESTGASPLPQANNFKTAPGSIMPPGLRLTSPPPAPASLREDMELTRAVAEDRTQIPDLGASEHLGGKQGASGQVTATQINAIVGQSSQGIDMRARVFRLDVAEGLQMAWALAIQYLVSMTDENGQPDQTSLSYIVDNQIRVLQPEAVHEDYEITPNGSADSWNKGAVVSKRMAYYQLFQNNPFIDKGELTKWLLEADDPRMVKRLFVDPGKQAATQAEDQSFECLLLASGTSPVVEESDDDKTHLQILAQWVLDKLKRVEMTPEIAGLTLKHGGEHMQGLQVKKDPMAKQIETQLKPLIEMLVHIAQQPGPPPKNILPMNSSTSMNNLQQPQTDQPQIQGSQEAVQAAAPISQSSQPMA